MEAEPHRTVAALRGEHLTPEPAGRKRKGTTVGWTVQFVTDSVAEVTEHQVAALDEELLEHSGSASGADKRFGATFSVDLEISDPVKIVEQAEQIYETAALRAGMPDGKIVVTAAMTFAEHDRELAEPAYPELVGIAEVAEMLGVSRQRASALQTREGFPQPLAVLASGPVWPKAWLVRFADEWDRKPGRPRKTAAA